MYWTFRLFSLGFTSFCFSPTLLNMRIVLLNFIEIPTPRTFRRHAYIKSLFLGWLHFNLQNLSDRFLLDLQNLSDRLRFIWFFNFFFVNDIFNNFLRLDPPFPSWSKLWPSRSVFKDDVFKLISKRIQRYMIFPNIMNSRFLELKLQTLIIKYFFFLLHLLLLNFFLWLNSDVKDWLWY